MLQISEQNIGERSALFGCEKNVFFAQCNFFRSHGVRVWGNLVMRCARITCFLEFGAINVGGRRANLKTQKNAKNRDFHKYWCDLGVFLQNVCVFCCTWIAKMGEATWISVTLQNQCTKSSLRGPHEVPGC